MRLTLRAALLAGALLASSGAALAEPISLANALAQGAEQSPRVAEARAKAEAAEARARQAGASPNPQLSLELEDFAGTGAFQGLRSTQTTLSVSQQIELGGKRGARVAVAASERDFALLSLRAAEADLARDIRIAHAELRAAEDRAVLARDNVGKARELARTAKLLVEVGRDPPLRQLRAEAVLAEAQAEEARTFGQLLAARRLLADLIGNSDPELSAEVADGEREPGVLPPATPSLDEQLAIAQRDAAQARIRVARADAVPDVTASGGVRQFGGEFGAGGETAFVAGVTIPLPFRNRNQGNIEAAQSEALASEAALTQARRDALRAQHDARMLLGAAEARVEVLSGPSLAQAEEAVRLAGIGYSAGKFSLLELLDAQAALTTAKSALIEARLDRARALAALIRATVRAGE
jgi:cobalt-zinc-cadmium efflux system outer membrane protein